MKVDRKLELAKQAVTFLATHDDASVSLRSAALDQLAEHIQRERAEMEPRAKDREAREVESLNGVTQRPAE